MFNKIIIQGRIAKLGEISLTPSQKSVLSFTVACDRDYDRESTDFIPVVTWGKTAEFVDRNFTKGQEIIVAGRLQIREWTDKENNRHTVAEINAESVNFCGSKKKEEKPEHSDSRFKELNGDKDLPFD